MSEKSLWGRLLLPLAVVVDECVLEDLEEPGLEIGPFLELVVVAVGLEVGLLNQILGVLGVAGHPVRSVVQRVHERHRQPLRNSTRRWVSVDMYPLSPPHHLERDTQDLCQEFTRRALNPQAFLPAEMPFPASS